MHFVTGGYWNGKREWVLKHYDFPLDKVELITPVPWIARSDSTTSSQPWSNIADSRCLVEWVHWQSELDRIARSTSPVIIEGLEMWILLSFMSRKQAEEDRKLEELRQYWQELFNQWRALERQDAAGDVYRPVIIIGSDITRGVVPLEKELRAWRDLVGWVYQDAVTLAERVDQVWYGIATTLKLQ